MGWLGGSLGFPYFFLKGRRVLVLTFSYKWVLERLSGSADFVSLRGFFMQLLASNDRPFVIRPLCGRIQ
jgi:hypothetical protein